jgi:uncharacterized membrane protein
MDELAEITEQDRQMAAAAYAIGGFSPLIALVIYFVGQSEFVKKHALKATIVHFVVAMVVTLIVFVTCGLGAPLILAAWGWGFWEGYQIMQGNKD